MSNKVHGGLQQVAYIGIVLLCFVSSITAALLVSGYDDIGFFIVATVPYSLLIGVVAKNLSQLNHRNNWHASLLVLFAGVVAGYIWTVFVFTFLTTGIPLLRVFEVWFLYYWMIGGIIGILSGMIVERRHRG